MDSYGMFQIVIYNCAGVRSQEPESRIEVVKPSVIISGIEMSDLMVWEVNPHISFL